MVKLTSTTYNIGILHQRQSAFAPSMEADAKLKQKNYLNHTISIDTGSGKTSLLDAISCQTSSGEVTGEVLINDKPTTLDIVKKHSAYVRQNDRLLPHLTVEETLMFVAQLKLPKSWSYEQIKTRVRYLL